MKLMPIQKQRVYQIIIEQIKTSIDQGQLKPGDRLPSERELAAQLAVSRSAVREALSVMEASRIIRIQPGVGIFLASEHDRSIVTRLNEILEPFSPDTELVQLLEVRQAVESQAAYLAALRRTDADVQAIRAAFDQLRHAVAAGRIAAAEDYRFHLAVVEAAHNAMLAEAVKLFSDRCLDGLTRSRSESIRIPGRSTAVLAEHERILRAIEDQDAEQARREMWEHLANVRTRYAIE